MERTELVFVYGTLLQAYGNGRRLLSSRDATVVGAGTVDGALHAVSGFPGLRRLSADEPLRTVAGEVVAVTPAHLTQVLDGLEGVCTCRGLSPDLRRCGKHGMYRRERIDVTLANGETVRAWTYIWNRPMRPEQPLIASGSYAQWRGAEDARETRAAE